MKSQIGKNKEIFEANIKYYWENFTNQRYYTAQVQQDLLRDWVVTTCWGKRHSRLGRLRTIFFGNETFAKKLLEKLDKIRTSHGYLRIKNE